LVTSTRRWPSIPSWAMTHILCLRASNLSIDCRERERGLATWNQKESIWKACPPKRCVNQKYVQSQTDIHTDGFSAIKEWRKPSIASMIGKASFSITLQWSWAPENDPLRYARGWWIEGVTKWYSVCIRRFNSEMTWFLKWVPWSLTWCKASPNLLYQCNNTSATTKAVASRQGMSSTKWLRSSLMTRIFWGVSGASLSLMSKKSQWTTWFLSSAWIASPNRGGT